MQNVTTTPFSQTLNDELTQLLELPGITTLGQNLRRLFIDYLGYELQTGTPVYFDEFLFPLNCLFDFLDVAANEKALNKTKQQNNNDSNNTKSKTPLQNIIDFITTTISPEKIFLISHTKNENEKECFDFIIVIPDVSQTAFNDYEQIISVAAIRNSELCFSLHQSSHISQQIQEGHIFYSTACTKQNLVYDDEKIPLAQTNPQKLKELKEKATTEFSTGIAKAKAFLQAANNSNTENGLALTAFMLHQSAELTLRTIILALTGKDIRTHSFNTLKKYCKRISPQLNQIFHPNTEEENRLISLMDKAYLNSRYTNDFQISPTDITTLSSAITTLQQNIQNIFHQKMKPL